MSQENGSGRRSADRNSGNGHNFVWYVLAAVAAATVVIAIVVPYSIERLSYPDFLELVKASKHVERHGKLARDAAGYIIVEKPGNP
ncbi:MAG: hypothetical protein KDA62_09640, partial [Planctomycetales bacterium]|nr:hypothetical protein [Planctomycetales bacterium]